MFLELLWVCILTADVEHFWVNALQTQILCQSTLQFCKRKKNFPPDKCDTVALTGKIVLSFLASRHVKVWNDLSVTIKKQNKVTINTDG